MSTVIIDDRVMMPNCLRVIGRIYIQLVQSESWSDAVGATLIPLDILYVFVTSVA